MNYFAGAAWEAEQRQMSSIYELRWVFHCISWNCIFVFLNKITINERRVKRWNLAFNWIPRKGKQSGWCWIFPSCPNRSSGRLAKSPLQPDFQYPCCSHSSTWLHPGCHHGKKLYHSLESLSTSRLCTRPFHTLAKIIWYPRMLIYHAGPVATAEMSIPVWRLARTVGTSLVDTVAAAADVLNLWVIECSRIHGNGSHKSAEESCNLHFERNWSRLLLDIKVVDCSVMIDVQEQEWRTYQDVFISLRNKGELISILSMTLLTDCGFLKEDA